MVSILIVSHSAQLAAGLKEFVDQIAGGKVQVRAVGGTADGRLGTSVERIQGGLQELATPDGVLVLLDIGGAALSVETALEDSGLAPAHVCISDAPLVEGTYLAALEAASGATLEQTAAAALQARDMIKVHR